MQAFAAICIPSLLVCFLHRVRCKQRLSIMRSILFFCLCTVLLHFSVHLFSLLGVYIDNTNDLIFKLNTYPGFAFKYFAFATGIGGIELILLTQIEKAWHRSELSCLSFSVKYEKLLWGGGVLLLIAGFVTLTVFMDRHADLLLNSDEASELVLAKLLSEENTIITRNWFYSTELRVLNTQIISATLFKLIGRWHTVRILTAVCLYIVLLGSCQYMMKKLGSRRWAALVGFVLILPFSFQYYVFVIKGLFYIPHIAISFFSIGLWEDFVQRKERQSSLAKCLAFLLLSFLLSVCVGLGGIRQLAILYLPAGGVGLLLFIWKSWRNKEKVHYLQLSCSAATQIERYAGIVLLSLLGSGLGYLINTLVLSRQFHFQKSGIVFHLNPAGLLTYGKGLFACFGFSKSGLFCGENALCYLWILLTIASIVHALCHAREVSGGYLRLALLTLFAHAVLIGVFLLTEQTFQERYFLPVIVLSVPLIALWISHLHLFGMLKKGIVFLLLILVMCKGIVLYSQEEKTDNTLELRMIQKALTEDGYRTGYASFWNANLMTELSDGALEMWIWCDSGGNGYKLANVESITETYPWLQATAHAKNLPYGKTFLLFTRPEYDFCNWKDWLDNRHIVYRSDGYVVYGYDRFEEIIGA